MTQLLRKWVRSFLIPFRVLRGLVWNRKSFLHQSGWIRSQIEGRPLLSDGERVPWMNYPVILFLKERIPADAEIFEYGSGSSTEFFAEHGARVVSVEHDSQWYRQVQSSLPENAELHHVPLKPEGTYPSFISKPGDLFNLVVVDGRQRVDCFQSALDHLTSCGCLVLDDSDRERYAGAFEAAEVADFRYLHFQGMRPRGRGISRTTIFYRDGNCLGI